MLLVRLIRHLDFPFYFSISIYFPFYLEPPDNFSLNSSIFKSTILINIEVHKQRTLLAHTSKK